MPTTMNIVLCPFHLYEGHTGKLITTILRPGRRIRGKVTAAILRRVFDRIRQAWPKVQILLRGDSHFSAPAVHDLCDEYEVDFILGQAVNKKLKTLGEPLMEEAIALSEKSEGPARLFSCFEYQAGTWACPRQVIYKAEITKGKPNPRFVVTNIKNRTPKFLYEKVYCARGRMEGFIKNHKTYLHSDRTSCNRFEGKPVPPLFAQCRLPAIARAQRHRSQRITMGEIQLPIQSNSAS